MTRCHQWSRTLTRFSPQPEAHDEQRDPGYGNTCGVRRDDALPRNVGPVRYLDPETRKASELSAAIDVPDLDRPFESVSPRLRFAAAVAEFAELLKESYWARDGSLDAVRQVALAAAKEMEAGPNEQEFVELVRIAGALEK